MSTRTTTLIICLALVGSLRGQVVNVGLQAEDFQIRGNYVVFRVSEVAQNFQDLNGDGDVSDFVIFVRNLSTGSTTNTGLATMTPRSGETSQVHYQLTDSLLAIRVSEIANGNSDLNGDGDAADTIVHVRNLSSGVTLNLDLATLNPLLPPNQPQGIYFRASGNLVAIEVHEQFSALGDLNADGDLVDQVVHVFNLTTGLTTNLAKAGADVAVASNRVAFRVSETAQGFTNLNGDFDTVDNVLHLYNASTGILTNIGLATEDFKIAGDILAFRVSEQGQGFTDFDGDGDTVDSVLHVRDLIAGTTSNIGLATVDYAIGGTFVGFRVSETGQGFTNLNGDGDTVDIVAHYYRLTNGNTINVGITAADIQANSTHIAFRATEQGQGGVDLDGDGDTVDNVLHIRRIAMPLTTNLMRACTDYVLGSELLAFRVPEQGQGGVDLDGDNDSVDNVLHVRNLSAATTTNVSAYSTAVISPTSF